MLPRELIDGRDMADRVTVPRIQRTGKSRAHSLV